LGSAQRTHAREREFGYMLWSVCDRIGPSTSILYGSVSWRLCQMKWFINNFRKRKRASSSP
jgi:hypothetical protein